MNTREIASSLSSLLAELVQGVSGDGGFVLNPGDEGLLRLLDRLSARDASALTPTGSSIAAHIDHVRYGLSLMNRWAEGENPFQSADWGASWTRTEVTDEEWQRLRTALSSEVSQWLAALGRPRDTDEVELKGMIASIVHLAYHMGAVRQINQLARGPRDGGG